jgi:hypothetical protein
MSHESDARDIAQALVDRSLLRFGDHDAAVDVIATELRIQRAEPGEIAADLDELE